MFELSGRIYLRVAKIFNQNFRTNKLKYFSTAVGNNRILLKSQVPTSNKNNGKVSTSMFACIGFP